MYSIQVGFSPGFVFLAHMFQAHETGVNIHLTMIIIDEDEGKESRRSLSIRP